MNVQAKRFFKATAIALGCLAFGFVAAPVFLAAFLGVPIAMVVAAPFILESDK